MSSGRIDFANVAKAGDSALLPAEMHRIFSLQGEMLREAVIRSDYDQLLDELCLMVESIIPNAVATVMLYDASRGELFVDSAPSLNDEAIQAFNGLRAGDGSCGYAVYHNVATYVCNTQDDPRWTNVAAVAERLGIRSCFSFPVPDAAGSPVASFAISSFEPRTPDRFHQALLETCTSICSVILQRREEDKFRKQIFEEQSRAERVESLGILAGGIAHDFNNMLTAIMANVDFSKSQLPAGPAREGLELAMKAVESASGLTRQLLTIAKGKSPVRAPSDISSIIRDSANFALHGSNVSYELIGLDALSEPVMNIDGGQVGQMIQNLVINARQAMPQGGMVKIACAEVDQTDHPTLEPGEYLRITVSDSGEGITEEVRQHLFEPYYTTRDTGSGLGLFLCYSIVKSHGGHISVESEPGVGSCITVHLRKTKLRDAAVQGPRSHRDVPSLSGNILIMDDDRLVRRTLKRILNQMGCQVWEAETGSEAVDCYTRLRHEGTNIDLFILDLTIPGGMGGIETKDEIKKRNPNAKVVVSSGYSIGDACVDYEAYGFDAAMMKPYSVATIRELLADLLA